MSLSIYVALFTMLALSWYRLSKIGQRPPEYPPGPPTLPIIGNLHQMPREKGHLQFQKWADEYGPVYSLILGTKVMIVLSSDRTVKDLLDKRSKIYSSRPDMYLGKVGYDVTWRAIRRIVHISLSINASKAYVPYQDLENKAMLMGLLEEPDRFVDHIRRYTNSLTTQMIFGFRTESIDDPRLKQLYHGFEKFCEVAGSQVAALLDVFPILRSLPDWILPIKRHAKRLHDEESKLYIGHWSDFKKASENGTAKRCFGVALLKAQAEMKFSDALAGYISGSLLEAGSDTTAAVLIGFIQAMVLFPEVMKKAQEELDRVCGGRLPTLEDMESLPYICSCVKESLRWMPTSILGVPHALVEDDNYLDYKIPKGASVICNVWSIHMDPKRHSNPRHFDPTRYQDDGQTAAEAANNPDASKRDHFVFGNGRRLCQGMHIAERSLFLAISRILWGFNIGKVVDAFGKEIVPDPEFLTEGLFVQPQPFLAKIEPRGSEQAETIQAEWKDMKKLLDENSQWKETPQGIM
ncbi:cytochrome p450 [Stemphylium lycopersici]|uniref:Cytochrome p450 n=1 Tax=Stemphylium lycopersici TaxID=183478 RepID=A0A364MRG7_STELY|nr:cytochrome p450 [Stemphylium lycopersici]RAQ98638.1 cytochrome p450 [Stemphylium lycopersici]RAR00262.1 cytochrome p450 [Stemphylium lycopersici]